MRNKTANHLRTDQNLLNRLSQTKIPYKPQHNQLAGGNKVSLVQHLEGKHVLIFILGMCVMFCRCYVNFTTKEAIKQLLEKRRTTNLYKILL